MPSIPTPGSASKANANPIGCLLIFFLPFFGFGIFFLLSGLKQGLFDGDSSGFGQAGFGLVFAAFPAIILFAIRKQEHKKGKLIGTGSGTAFAAHPAWPRVKNQKTGQFGTVLQNASVGSGCAILVIGFFALFWNGISWTAAIGIFNDAGGGGMKWGALAFISIFLLIGLGLIALLVHQILRAVLVGDPRLELTKEPLAPGDRARLTVFQPGNFPITSAKITLIAQERATYRVGTTTHTAEHNVLEEVLAEASDLRASKTQPLFSNLQVVIPPNAMHSFKLGNNELAWKIKVELDIPNRPDVKDDFLFRVAPLEARS
ncbi:MAG: hypothetical protein RLY93_06915 [Sumerlaeia bacterium]